MDADEDAEINRLLSEAREARQHRQQLPTIVAQLRALGVSYRLIFEASGVPISTAQAWMSHRDG